MKISKLIIPKIFLFLIPCQFFINTPKVESAENIKIIYSIFSRTIKVNSLKEFSLSGNSTNELRRILNATGSTDIEIQTAKEDEGFY